MTYPGGTYAGRRAAGGVRVLAATMVVVLGLVATLQPLQAQRTATPDPSASSASQATGDPDAPSHRRGLWAGAGLGAGFDRVFCEICDGSVQAGWSGYLRLGGTVGPRLLLGGELTGWLKGQEEVTRSIGAVSFVAYWYPRDSGLYLKGGGGAQTQPFPGSIRQFIARKENDRGPLNPSGPAVGAERNYGGPGVHAPN